MHYFRAGDRCEAEGSMHPMTPLFTIVIANYNYGRFLDDAIQSVVAQNLGNQVELIICDAGSTDNSVDVIKKYANGLPPNTQFNAWVLQSPKRLATQPNGQLVTWWCSEKDGGQSAAFNKGFSHAKGRFLVWLNADDILTSGALKAVAHEIEKHPTCEWFIGSSIYADADLKVTRCFCAHRFSVLRAKWGFLSAGGPSSFFTKRLLDAVGGIDESLHYVMDTDLWHKFYLNCGAKYRRTRHNIFAYRQHEASKMSGADEHTTARALENRRRAKVESEVLAQRYGRRCGLSYKLAHVLSLSFADYVVAWWRNLNWRGHRATEI